MDQGTGLISRGTVGAKRGSRSRDSEAEVLYSRWRVLLPSLIFMALLLDHMGSLHKNKLSTVHR